MYKRKLQSWQTKRELIFILDVLICHFLQNRRKLDISTVINDKTLISWYTL